VTDTDADGTPQVRYAFDADIAEAASRMSGADISDVGAARSLADHMFSPALRPYDGDAIVVERRHIPGRGVDQVEVIVVARRDRRSSPVGALLQIHGGGFSIGRAEHDIPFAQRLLSELDIVLVLIDYRLAPEHPYPAGIADCYATLCWVNDHAEELGIDRERIGVYGTSAGATLAAGTALLARDLGGPPLCFQCLVVPVLDDRLETPSMRQFVDTPMWNRRNAALSWANYLGGEPEEVRPDVSPYASPARAGDLAGLPPTYISTAEFDPLRDEGVTYALRLLQAGVPVELHQYAGTFHGSVLVDEARSTQRQLAEMVEVLDRALGPAASDEHP
jgi:acetyl esterase/lipase